MIEIDDPIALRFNGRMVISSYCVVEFTTFALELNLFDRCLEAKTATSRLAKLRSLTEQLMEIVTQSDLSIYSALLEDIKTSLNRAPNTPCKGHELMQKLGLFQEDSRSVGGSDERLQLKNLPKSKLISVLLFAAQVSVFSRNLQEATEWNRRQRAQLLMQQKKEAVLFLTITRAPDLTIYIKEAVIPLLELLTLMCDGYSSLVYQAKHIRQQLTRS